MKYLCIFLIALASMSGWSKDVKDFNSELIKTVQKDIKNENDDQFKSKKVMKREPASVDEQVEIIPDPKLDKLKQIGPNKW